MYRFYSPTLFDKEPFKFNFFILTIQIHLQDYSIKKTIEDKVLYGSKNYTNSITTISAASPRRGPTFKIRVYPPLRSA